jgi:hypothetical protein
MPLQFFITAEETCLQTLNETLSNNTYQTIYYSSNGSLSSGFQIPAMAISYFYLTNGWHTVGTSFDSNAYTSIMLSEGVGNCWSVDPSDTTLIVSSCKSSSAQTFYVSCSRLGCLQRRRRKEIDRYIIASGRCSFSFQAWFNCHKRSFSNHRPKPGRRCSDGWLIFGLWNLYL